MLVLQLSLFLLLEPFATVLLPYKGGECLIRTHPELGGRDAELCMQAWEFDMGRYADLLLNMAIGILIFMFPGGYTLTIFFGVVGSHIYIYAYDHWKVLRVIPRCVYATMDVDWWAQWMLAPITAMILMCLVVKANCQGFGYCIDGIKLIEVMWTLFVLHTCLHTSLLHCIPLFGLSNDEAKSSGDNYYTVAKAVPCNWFSANPVKCLRSKLLYKHEPPCDFHVIGKEHLLRRNEGVGNCYEATMAEREDYQATTMSSLKEALTHLSGTAGVKPPSKRRDRIGEWSGGWTSLLLVPLAVCLGVAVYLMCV